MRTTLILIGSLLFISSCESWLEVEPENSLSTTAAFTSPEQLDAALNGAYHLLLSSDLAGRNWFLFSDCMGGNMALLLDDFTEFSQLNIDIHNQRVERLWTTSYVAINQLNRILAAIDEIAGHNPGFSAARQDQLRGEALTLRAVIYYYLLRYFALPDTPATQDSLGVPLVLEAVTAQSQLHFPARTSIAEVSIQIEADLQEARQRLPYESQAGRVNTYVADAYLAKLAMQRQQWTLVEQRCKGLIDGPYALAGEPQTFFREEGSVEEIWVLKADQTNGTGLNWSYENSRIDPELTDGVFQELLSPEQQFSLMQNHRSAIDLRADTGRLTNDPLLSPGMLFSRKYENQALDSGDDPPLLRLAEIHLMLAEALAQQGYVEEAVDQLNLLRRRAFRIVDDSGQVQPPEETGSWVDLDADDLTTEALLKAIARERRAELAFEGDVLHDLIRRGQNIRDSIPWNAPRLRLPIPQRELDANPNLVQNPGY